MRSKKYNKYNEEFYRWLEKNYKGSINEVLQRIKSEFGYDMSYSCLHDLISSLRKKYNIPRIDTKGLTGPKPKPFGTPVMRDRQVKLRLENGSYILYDKYIYEQVYGKQPNDYIMVYIDGNNKNNDITNLYMISRQQDVYIKSNKLTFANKEELKTLCLISNLATKKPHYIRPSRRKENINARKELFI